LEGLAGKPPVKKERDQIQAKISECEQMIGKLTVKLAQIKKRSISDARGLEAAGGVGRSTALLSAG
jgi:hypothetical protein